MGETICLSAKLSEIWYPVEVGETICLHIKLGPCGVAGFPTSPCQLEGSLAV